MVQTIIEGGYINWYCGFFIVLLISLNLITIFSMQLLALSQNINAPLGTRIILRPFCFLTQSILFYLSLSSNRALGNPTKASDVRLSFVLRSAFSVFFNTLLFTCIAINLADINYLFA